MEEDQEFSDGQLRHALLLHMDGTRDVEAPLIDALEQRGYLAGPTGRQRITASGRRVLGGDTPLDDDVKAVVLASQLLRHVIPLGIERDTPDGGRVVLTSIEVWSHEVVLQWTEICTAQRPPFDRSDPFESVRLTDDLGTPYPRLGGGGSGVHTQQMCCRFQGTPPNGAAVMSLTLPKRLGEHAPIRVDLP